MNNNTFAISEVHPGKLNALRQTGVTDHSEAVRLGEWTLRCSDIYINRGCCNTTRLIGEGWSTEDNETDTRSTRLIELYPSRIELVTMLRSGETRVNGEEKLKRLKESDYIRLDADIFMTFWENQPLIPESWKKKVNGKPQYIFFNGTVLRAPDGRRYVLCLCLFRGGWSWNYSWRGSDWHATNASAVLAIHLFLRAD